MTDMIAMTGTIAMTGMIAIGTSDSRENTKDTKARKWSSVVGSQSSSWTTDD
jgi:hypothetical protein